METFKDRLIKEQSDLQEKITKLRDFLRVKDDTNWEDIDHVQRSLLRIQLNSMLTYNECLRERIAWLD